jgi:hypothetical protein
MSNTLKIGAIGFAWILLNGFAAGVQAQVIQDWVAYYTGAGAYSDYPSSEAVDAAGNVYVAGTRGSSATFSDYILVKYNSAGIQQWVAAYNGPGNYGDQAWAMAADAAGNTYVTGNSWDAATVDDYATIKFSSAGVQQWVARYNGPANYQDQAWAIARDAAGNLYVTGFSYSDVSTLNYDFATVKYDANGVQQWVARYDGPGHGFDWANAIAVDALGSVYVTGRSYGGAVTDFDYATIKYNSAGVQQWAARYNSPQNGPDSAEWVAVDNEQNVYVTGWSTGIGFRDYATIKYDADGIEQWVARYNGPADFYDDGTRVVVDGQKNVYVTGYSTGIDTWWDYATIKYDSTGAQQWVARYNGPLPVNGEDQPHSLALGSDGYIYVSGSSQGNGTGYDYATVKYGPDGVQQWAIRFDITQNTGQRFMTLDAANNVYITGTGTFGLTNSDFVTVKYSQGSPINITMTPVNPPLQIPATGGSFSFDISIQNISTSQQTFDFWIMQRLPINTWQGPMLGPIALNMSPGATITRQRTQNVPGRAIPGIYAYIGYVGAYSAVKWDSSFFTYTKLASSDGPAVSDWSGSGEDFSSDETIITPHSSLLASVMPNPFNPSATITFALPQAERVILSVYDLSGRRVAELVNGRQEAGQHRVNFDGSNLASGIYLYRLSAGNYAATGKMVLMK